MLSVSTQYYLVSNPLRQKEIDTCLQNNIANPLITQLIIYFEKQADMALIENHPKIEKRLHPERMTYGFWLKETNRLPVGTLSLLLNSDMYLTESVSYLIAHAPQIAQQKRFIALSRYNPDYQNNPEQFLLNDDPHWTQDVWGVARTDEAFAPALLQEAAFELGQPGCDNKIAYVMHSYGFHVTNPCFKVKTVHLQADDGTRSYDPKKSKLLGLHAFVYPVESVLENSVLDFDLLTRSASDPQEIRVNNWINERRSYELKVPAPATASSATASSATASGSASPAASPSAPTAPSAPAEVARAITAAAVAAVIADSAHDEIDPNASYVLKNQFKYKLYREIVRFSDRFIVYDDFNAYYFFDKFWPVVKRVLKRDVSFNEIKESNFELFATGFLTVSLSEGVVDMSNEMEYTDDILFWQYPCRTESDAYEAHQQFSGTYIEGHVINVYLALPWATFVDKQRYPEGLLGLYASRIAAAQELAAQFSYTLRVHTVC
jgi:hypothetical protein